MKNISKYEMLVILMERGRKALVFLNKIIEISRGGLFINNQENQTRLQEELSIKRSSYFKMIKTLEKDNILIKDIKGVYIINNDWVQLLEEEKDNRIKTITK